MNDPQLTRRIEAYLRGTITDEDFAALEAQLANAAAARREFRRAANLDSALRDWASRPRSLDSWLVPPPSPAGARRKWLFPWGLAAAAVVCIGAYFLGGFRHRTPPTAAEATAHGAAILTQTIDADWETGRPRQRMGATLSPGRLALRSGLVQIEFFSGAALVVAGPAEFEIVSPWKVLWHHGKARVKVPPAARGFELTTPGMKVIDLGTEFGVDVDRATAGSRLQVFSGEIEAHPHAGARVSLKEGQGLEQRGDVMAPFATLQPQDFPSVESVGDLNRARAQSQFERWAQFSHTQRQDARLLAYYPMEPDSPGQRLVRNRAQPADPLRDGGAVGAAWSTGRWPQKSALEFKGPGDRVRLQIDGTYSALTFVCWAKIDGLDRKYNALFLTDGYEPGEPHWQIFEDGRLMFSLTYPDASGQRKNFISYSPVVFSSANTGRWHHLAVTYDNRTGAVIHYVDGREIGREIAPPHVPGRPVVIGPSELGNWGLPTEGHRFPVRNLNGSLDEFGIFSAALSGDEIHRMFEAGSPE